MTTRRPRVTRPPMQMRTLAITSLAAGGDGVARDEDGRVTFVPRTAPGDRVRARLVHATKSFARAELESVEEPSPERVAPPCPRFADGCGGCTWQHVSRAAQLAAKQAIVTGALRKLTGLVVHPVADPAPSLGWRRRARFHVSHGAVGLFVLGTNTVLPIDHCPQLEPALDAALAAVRAASPPDGELSLLAGQGGAVVVAASRAWPGAAGLVGTAGIIGVVAGTATHGTPTIELEPGLWAGPTDFAQASAAGNAALIARTRAALGAGPGTLVELYAGAGNVTRALVADGWRVLATDGVAPPRALALPDVEHRVGPVAEVLEGIIGPVDAVVLDPPRVGAADAIDGIVRLSPRVIVYVSCDPATLARDLERLVTAGYRATEAWPIDLMPQTAHVEVVVHLAR